MNIANHSSRSQLLPSNWETSGYRLLDAHEVALQQARRNMPDAIREAASLILATTGKVVLTGLGKSGQIAQKIASSLSSTGTPALFINAADALHGDLGVVSSNDIVIMLSNSGSTIELIKMVPQLQRLNVPMIGILGKPKSSLGNQMNAILDAGVPSEGSPHNLAPMASCLCALAIGDCLTAILMDARNVTPDDFSQVHPAGQLGRNLLLTAREAMHSGNELPRVHAQASIRQVVIEMTRSNLGLVCICSAEDQLLGILTDGDIRRFLTHSNDLESAATSIMTRNPTVIAPDQRLGMALSIMEQKKIYVLPVVDEHNTCLGVLRMHDILTPTI
jgi:arabinose-5-phosphate isomerase